jgi:hypothetical protein
MEVQSEAYNALCYCQTKISKFTEIMFDSSKDKIWELEL